MDDIEDTAARNLLNSLWEFMLIIKAKEKDFARRCQVKRGLYLYFKDTLPEVIQTKDALLDTFIRMQGIVQKIKGKKRQCYLKRRRFPLENKPLTKRQLEDLIIKITEQPKLIEHQVLQLLEELKKKVVRVETLLHKVEKWVSS
ncbi:hypothetical protein ZIOFF_060743 [Zingiber officinale]|uniref:Uncharacterized protein n=1 Tax=Zingiber officinale TaxID=94328 RepID=A0A8J5FH13_ZINOF|nr:hypothetical protein ZIOFF_060743 [Zingiber officinale]